MTRRSLTHFFPVTSHAQMGSTSNLGGLGIVVLAAAVLAAGPVVGCDSDSSGSSDAARLDGAADSGIADSSAPRDAEPLDSQGSDAGPLDSGPTDVPAMDASDDDAGPVDAGPADAGLMDAGPADAGPVDAGPADAGLMDAGPGPISCPPTVGCAVREFLGNEYCICSATRSWARAQTSCQSAGLQLVRIDDVSENNFFYNAFSFRSFWIGGSDAVLEGEFTWPDGTAFWTGGLGGSSVGGAYTNWRSGQPNDPGGVNDCIAVLGGEWRTPTACNSVGSHRFACER